MDIRDNLIARRTAVNLGMPASRDIAGRHATTERAPGEPDDSQQTTTNQ